MTELFDLTDLAAYAEGDLDTATATIRRRIATSLIQSYIGADPRPFTGNRTVYLPVPRNWVLPLPALLDSVVSVTGTDDAPLTYVWRDGSRSLSLTSFIYPSAWYGQPYEAKLTYTYVTVPGPVRDAALLIADSMAGPASVSGGSTVGIQSESIDDYTVRYTDGSTPGAEYGMPPEASALLASYRRSPRTVRLVSQ